MKAITLRNIPLDIQKAIQRRARKTGSVNKAVISLLEESTGGRKRKKVHLYHDLDKLAGTWSKREADDFDRTLALQRQIDSELWSK